MGAYLARRLLALVPTMLLASLIVFITIRLMPGDVIDLMLSQNDVSADKLSRDQLVAALGVDQPVGWQYLRWVGAIVLHGDLGRSLWQNTPVTELLLARLPVTFELGALALLVGLVIALPIGIYSALRQDTAHVGSKKLPTRNGSRTQGVPPVLFHLGHRARRRPPRQRGARRPEYPEGASNARAPCWTTPGPGTESMSSSPNGCVSIV